MAAPIHSQQTDTEGLHKPKDFDSAANSTALIKDENGDLIYRLLSSLGATGPTGPAGTTLQSISVADINAPTELNTTPVAPTTGDTVKVYQVRAINNIVSSYIFDTATTVSENPPFSVDGDGGMWILQSAGWETGISTIVSGYFKESIRTTITSDGATITLALDQVGGGDLTRIHLGTELILDTTPAKTVALTAGSTSSPQENFVYTVGDNLLVSTTGFPSTVHHKVDRVLVQSASDVQTHGPLKEHQYRNDVNTLDTGELDHVTGWIRKQNATWESGVATSTNVGVSTFDVAVTSGVVSQFHAHIFPALDTAVSDFVFVPNDFTTPYVKVTDLSTMLTDSQGNSLSNTRFNFVLWGSMNHALSKIFINVPSDSYNNDSDAISDSSRTASFTIPQEFKGTGFLIARITVRHISASSTWSILQTEDLRGQFPSTAVGGISGAVSVFADNAFELFDEGDNTKRVAFQASGVSTATTRTQTVPDQNGIIAHRNNDNAFTVAQTFGNNLTVQGQGHSDTNTLADGANIATNCNTGNVHTVTLAGNRTLDDPTNLKNGGTYIWIIKQDGGGTNTLAYGSAFLFEGGVAPVLSTGADEIDILSGVSDGTSVYAQLIKDFS